MENLGGRGLLMSKELSWGGGRRFAGGTKLAMCVREETMVWELRRGYGDKTGGGEGSPSPPKRGVWEYRERVGINLCGINQLEFRLSGFDSFSFF